MKGAIRDWILMAAFLVTFYSGVFVFAQMGAQGCVTTVISTQISELGMHGNATVPSVVEKLVEDCVYWNSILAAASLGISSVMAAVLGAALSNRLRAGPSTGKSIGMSAHYEPDASRLILRFDRPTVVQNPQRMVLLYHHADGIATTVPGRQCEDDGLTLGFTADVEKPPMLMELVIYSGAMYPAGFPDSDVCAGGRPIRINVDILFCDTKSG